MPVYELAIRQGNRVVERSYVAKDPLEASAMARRDGGIIVRPPKARKTSMSRGMSAAERYLLLYKLSTIVKSREQITKGLEIMRNSYGGRIGAACAVLESGLAAGKSFADIMVEDRRNYPEAVAQLVRAGANATGGMAEALVKAADFENEMLSAQLAGTKGVWSAGAWVTGGAIGTLACPLWLTPYLQESDLFQLTDKPVSWDWLDYTAYAFGGGMALMMLLAFGLFFVVVVGQRLFPRLSDNIVKFVPVLNQVIFARDNFISLFRFGMLVKAGVTMEIALDSTHRDTRKGLLRDDLGRGLENIRRGKPWVTGFQTIDPVDRAALAMATDKERLGEILTQVADQNKALYIRRLNSVQPVLGFTGGLSMIIVYGVSGLYSIVPFAGLFEQLLGSAYGTN